MDVDLIRPQGAGSTTISLYASFPVTESPKVGEVTLNPADGFIRNISLPIRAGDYYLKVDSSQETNLASIYSFRISLKAGSDSDLWELEPNGVLQFANALPLNGLVKGTSWHPNDDLDWYKVRLDNRGTFVVSFFKPFGTNATEIRLKSANGGDIPQVPPAKASQLTGQKATISANLNLGDYYVVIDPENEEDPSAEYNLVTTILDSIKLEIQQPVSSIQYPTSNIQHLTSIGDLIKLTAIWIPNNTLTFDIGDLRLGIPMYDDGASNN